MPADVYLQEPFSCILESAIIRYDENVSMALIIYIVIWVESERGALDQRCWRPPLRREREREREREEGDERRRLGGAERVAHTNGLCAGWVTTRDERNERPDKGAQSIY